MITNFLSEYLSIIIFLFISLLLSIGFVVINFIASPNNPDPEKYQQFLVQSNIDTFLIEMQIRRRLVGVSVIDHVANGLSAVYTFFDPIEERRSLGTLAILNQIELAQGQPDRRP